MHSTGILKVSESANEQGRPGDVPLTNNSQNQPWMNELESLIYEAHFQFKTEKLHLEVQFNCAVT